MKTTVTVNSRGVVTIPAKLRRAVGIRADDQLIAEATAEGLLLRPAVTLPIEMYSDARIKEFDVEEAELAKALRGPRKKKPSRWRFQVRLFLDANILFSAARSAGAVRQLLDVLLEASHECWADTYVVEEARRNLAAKAPDGLIFLDRVLGSIRIGGTQSHRISSQALLSLPEKDRPVLAAAIQLKCAALVTGDRRHFGHMYGQTIEGVTIHSPRSLVDALFTPR
jgi:AbrB family looped-hinge helix DNA binding protein